jgi:Ras-related protein Rab-6A
MASVKIPEQKVILVGDFGVGKSSLFRRFMNENSFVSSTDRKATLGKRKLIHSPTGSINHLVTV